MYNGYEDLELIIKSHISDVVPVSHHNLQPVVSLIGQSVKGVKAKPALSLNGEIKNCYISDMLCH